MDKLAAFFTPVRRKAVYGVVAAVLTVLVAFGLITAQESEHWLSVTAGVIAALTNLMAFLNTNVAPTD